jgi:nucleoside-diphosphate-sugar epimerase
MRKTEMPTVLVTGASGFVGRAVLEALGARNVTVRAVSRRPRSEAPPASAVTWLRADLAAEDGWGRLIEGTDTIVHLAGNPGTGTEAAMMRANCEWTAALARRAMRAGVRRFVYASTVRVYGRQPAIDAETAADPADAYGRSKLAAEDALLAEAHGGGMATSILRPPFVFGADRAGLFSLMAAAARHGIPLPLGALRNRRSLINAGNLGDLIATAALDDPDNGSYRLPAGEGFDPTYGELFRLIGDTLGRRARTFSVPGPMLRIGARMLWAPDTARRLFEDCVVDGSALAGRLGWAPGATPQAALRSILIAR